MNSRELLNALSVAERLKDTTRHCYTSKGRHESVAEHSWMMTLMAFFMRDEFPDVDMDSSLVELEILETTFIDALDTMINVINALREKGFRINVDDFGSGYSSLSQIANIPADIIKFDRVFASRSLKNDKGRQVIKSLIEMLKMVNYDLVFEGIETKEELDAVVSYGCDVIQGFYFDKPLSAKEFIKKYYMGGREATYGTQ